MRRRRLRAPAEPSASQDPARADRHSGTHRRAERSRVVRWPHCRRTSAVGCPRARPAVPVPVFRAARRHRPVARSVVAARLRRHRARRTSTPATRPGCHSSSKRFRTRSPTRWRCVRWVLRECGSRRVHGARVLSARPCRRRGVGRTTSVRGSRRSVYATCGTARSTSSSASTCSTKGSTCPRSTPCCFSDRPRVRWSFFSSSAEACVGRTVSPV